MADKIQIPGWCMEPPEQKELRELRAIVDKQQHDIGNLQQYLPILAKRVKELELKIWGPGQE